MTTNSLKSFYNTILCQAFSPCGNYFVAGDIYGEISVFHLSKLINPEVNLTKEQQIPKYSFTVEENVQINSLLSTDLFLIVGVAGVIKAYSWKSIKSSKSFNCSWTIDIPNQQSSVDKPEINSLYFDNEKEYLFAGCGDNNVYVYQIETRKLIKTLSGHKDYIHDICGMNNNLISGGEDGDVCLWDLRDFKMTNKIQPFKDESLDRPDLGKWIGAVGLSEDFFVCGGGPRLSLWHFRSLNCSTIFPIEDRGIHVAKIYQNRVLAGGTAHSFYQYNFNGDPVAKIPTSSVTTYSVIYQDEPYNALCIAGSSKNIDVCRNYIYRDLVLSV